MCGFTAAVSGPPLGFGLMLTELVVEDLGVIERVELTFERGSSALTGETGAGKTLVVAALGLLLGGRADRSLVRTGAARAEVESRFCVGPSHRVARLLEEQGLGDGASSPEGVEVVVSRSVSVDGRTKARVNGRLVTAVVLGQVTRELVEIDGQHEHAR